MVASIGSTSNLINMVALSYQKGAAAPQQTAKFGGFLPSPQADSKSLTTQAPRDVLNTAGSKIDGSISIYEYYTLAEGIRKVTGSTLSRTFVDFDADGDGVLSITELKSVLDEAGISPLSPPPGKVIAAYEAQSGNAPYRIDNDDLLAQLFEYLESRSKDIDIFV